MAGNGTPHLIKGMTKEQFANPFSTSPVVNLLLGWALYVLAGYLTIRTHVERHPDAALAAAAAGLLLTGLFQAQVGAIGKQPEPGTR